MNNQKEDSFRCLYEGYIYAAEIDLLLVRQQKKLFLRRVPCCFPRSQTFSLRNIIHDTIAYKGSSNTVLPATWNPTTIRTDFSSSTHPRFLLIVLVLVCSIGFFSSIGVEPVSVWHGYRYDDGWYKEKKNLEYSFPEDVVICEYTKERVQIV